MKMIHFLIYLIFFASLTHGQTYIQGRNLIEVPATIATAGSSTTLTSASQTNQQFTGTAIQTVILPNATTLQNGRRFYITNRSTGNVTVNYNGGTLAQTMVGNTEAILIVESNATSIGTWDISYFTVPPTQGSLTDVGTDGILISGGLNAVFGAGTSLAQHVAGASNNGYLASSDWTTFNSKGTGSVTSISTDATLTGGPITTTGTLKVDVGTAANQILQLNGSAQIPAVNGALLTNINAVQLQGFGIATTSPTSNQLLTWNSTSSLWTPTVPATSGTVTSVAMAVPSFLSISGSPVTGIGTLSVSYSGTALPIANGGTAATSAANGTIPNATSSSAASWTATPILGIASSVGGSLGLAGATAGIATLSPAANTTNHTVTLPANVCSNNQVWTDNGSGVMSCNSAPAPSYTSPNLVKILTQGSTTGWYMTTSALAANVNVGCTYTNNGHTYVVVSQATTGATIIYVSGASTPASGTLTYSSGASSGNICNDATTPFSANITISSAFFAMASYTPSSSLLYIHVRAIAGGGGGGGGGTAIGSGTAGGSGGGTVMIANGGVGSILTLGGGGGGGVCTVPTFGTGGAATLSSPGSGFPTAGGAGGYGINGLTSSVGGWGATGAFLAGAGIPGEGSNGGGIAGGAAVVNTGSGGGGGDSNNTTSNGSGGGGGAGGYADFIIPSPLASSYYYIVGTAGSAGAACTSGGAGGLGGSGAFYIEEHYQ